MRALHAFGNKAQCLTDQLHACIASAKASAAAVAAEHGVQAVGLVLDVSDFKDIEACADAAIAWQGHVDILFNNAGGGSGPGAKVHSA